MAVKTPYYASLNSGAAATCVPARLRRVIVDAAGGTPTLRFVKSDSTFGHLVLAFRQFSPNFWRPEGVFRRLEDALEPPDRVAKDFLPVTEQLLPVAKDLEVAAKDMLPVTKQYVDAAKDFVTAAKRCVVMAQRSGEAAKGS